ncbi:MAG: alpha/beta hydrolase, partial [Akkermansiaceae bacterium]|nr:alpha/beta hydrolase [Armatimonadota bacterium]
TPAKDIKNQVGGGADAYGKWMAETLKPTIDRAFRTKRDAANTAIGGSSLGGLFSLRQSLTAPTVWGKAAVLSPSVWWADRSILQTVSGAPKKPVRLWVDIGTAEDKEGRAVKDTQALRDALLKRGWKSGIDLAYKEIPGAGHNEPAWAARFGEVLVFLFPPVISPSPGYPLGDRGRENARGEKLIPRQRFAVALQSRHNRVAHLRRADRSFPGDGNVGGA